MVTLSKTAQWHNLPADDEFLTYSIKIGSGTAVTVQFGSQAISATATATAPNAIGATTVVQQRTAGYQFSLLSTSSITVSDFLSVTVAAGSALTLYGNQTFSFTATRPTQDSLTLGSTSPLVQSIGGWSGTTATVTCKGTAAGSYTVAFTVSAAPNFYYTTPNPASFAVTILQQQTIVVTSTATGAVIVDGDQFTVTLTLSQAVTSALTVTATLSAGAPLQVVSGSFAWANGATQLTATVTYAATATSGPVQPTLTFTHGSPQYLAVAAPWSVIVNPKVTADVVLDGSTDMTTGQTFNVRVVLSKVYRGRRSSLYLHRRDDERGAVCHGGAGWRHDADVHDLGERHDELLAAAGDHRVGGVELRGPAATALRFTSTYRERGRVAVLYAETRTLQLRATPAAELKTNNHVVRVDPVSGLVRAVSFSGGRVAT